MAERRKLGGKKPVHLRASGGALTVRDRIWAAIRARRTRFTKADIVFDTKASAGSVRSYFEQLLKGGYLRALEDRPRSQTCPYWTWTRYELARDVGVDAPRLRRDGSAATLGRGREQMWRTVKILREFDARELQAAASTDGHRVALTTAKDYVLQLARGGYVVLARRGRNGVYSRYRFLRAMNTGPRSPIAQKSRAIFDPNLGRLMWQP
jgi:hypothetical protein